MSLKVIRTGTVDSQSSVISRPYNLYCVGADVKPCSIKLSGSDPLECATCQCPLTAHIDTFISPKAKVLVLLFHVNSIIVGPYCCNNNTRSDRQT